MSTCPYCHSVYQSTMPPTNLSRRQQAIYDTVVSGGPKGTPVKRLIEAMYGDTRPPSAWGILRVNIFEINQRIRERGQRIKGRRDLGYFLVEDRAFTDDYIER